jgi:cobalt/nickel transport system permease protein
VASLVRTKFLDKTLLAVARVAEQSLFSEAYARKRGLLQALDVRVKLITFLCILILISVLHAAHMIWFLYLFALILAASSRIPLGFFLTRVWLFVPLFTAAVVLPALLNIITPGDPLWVVMRLERTYAWGPYTIPAEVAVTRQGLGSGILLVSRVATSVSFGVLFTLTTKWAEVFAGLRSLFVPRVFVVTLGMTERYLFVYLRLIQDMYRARKSRTIRPLSAGNERNWTASRIGITFRRSIDMSSDVYNAMLSRGFHGEYRTLNRFHVRTVDYLWLIAIISGGSMLLVVERGHFR